MTKFNDHSPPSKGTFHIRFMKEQDLPHVLSFCDYWIGPGYFSLESLEKGLAFSRKDGLESSLVAFKGGKLVAIRLTFAPGQWLDEIGRPVACDKWEVGPEQVAYFKTLYIAKEYRGRGLGKMLSQQALEVLRKMGTRAIVCHSWLESPHNSSQKYLLKFGFKPVAHYPHYWADGSYDCTRCMPQPCCCSAVEMIKYLS